MIRAQHPGLLVALVLGLAGCSCADRQLEEQPPPPDIDGLCQTYCARIMECVWAPDIGATFSTAQECTDNCRSNEHWTTACTEPLEQMLECELQYDCPRFAEIWYGPPEDEEQLCRDPIHTYSVCVNSMIGNDK